MDGRVAAAPRSHAAETYDEVYAAIGHHPNKATGYTDAITDELRELRSTRSAWRSARPASTTSATTRPAPTRSAPSRPRSSSRTSSASRWSSTPAPPRTTRSTRSTQDADGPGGRSCTASRCPTGSRSASSTAGGSRSPATSPTRRRSDLAEAAERVPLDRLLVETDAPYLTPQVVRKERNRPAYVTHTARFIAERRGHRLRGARRGGRGQRRASCSAGERRLERRSRACAGCASSASGPNRELGQNFLVDSNILDVIGRAAELDRRRRRARGRRRPRRAQRVPRRAHRARPRRRARPRPRAGAAGRAGPAPEHHAALRRRGEARPRGARPAPTKVVANLPYGVAATVILRTIELPAVDELGGDGAEGGGRALRGAARARAPTASRRCSPSSPATCRVIRKVPRGVFHPVPNVDSVLVGLKRHSAAPPDSLKRSSSTASRIAARRSRSRSRWPRARAESIRDRTREALDRARPPRRRPRRGALARRMARALGAAVLAPGQGQPVPARRRAARRRPAPARLGRPADDARRQAHAGARARARRTTSSAPASRATTSPPARCGSSARRPAGTARRSGSTIAKRIPIAAGHGGRLERRRRRAAAARPRLGPRDPAAAADAARRRRHRDALRPARADDRRGRARRGAARPSRRR